MIKSLWTAKTGLESQQTKLDVISNNLANVGTNGFKRSRPVFEDLLYQNMRQPGAQNNIQDRLPSGMQVGTGVRAVATERLHTQGSLEETQNSRDLAIEGNGFFEVLLPDGTAGYTRDGSFQLNENGQMVTANGYPIEPAIFLPVNALSVTIGEDGIVSVRQPGIATDTEVGQISLSTFINPAGLESIGGNLYLETGASGAPNQDIPGNNGAGRLFQGYVETSNVNVVEEMVNMIQTQRAYEINSRAISTSDEMLARLSQL
ncbi:flagellar basal-body rod protein FlgG [Vreelandella aquamarina]|jgi:flagellar basal-body rod protein FlgG|uniref:Flagellar basal-body rod protein FlgG n=1 Tax=Vreelandella aquamarina TaxID=77097 RepID=A0A6F8XET9_9GAMM|nr:MULTISPECIES: flagellar basal-body rod protein FlgG [Halomonas]KTG27827.1 flagellar basal-body rod protein FlgG [Idiomarina sp. H105]MEC8900287.1 flagellar basal-body rod protein FlgG [Pseudomonadota bacterium]OAF06314.1 flagellar basal-body rod protein FlgG [Idiomarina sp. WRN-38]MAD21927.1 flagellar basal-body rod protein FlgG [Halomonas sp.]MCC4291605.1 flagellar basal-body rod protein FlgG [Halomonas axialensis]|tara:strand:- start:583 stop:1365 length:783 start_codon:yes stop_codon:yes gene_type:complete